MNHKKILSLCFATALIANLSYASIDDDDPSYRLTEEDVNKKIENEVKESCMKAGWFNYSYENTKKKRDGEKIEHHIKEKIKEDDTLKKVVLRYNGRRVRNVAKREKIEGLKKVIHGRIEKNYSGFSCVKREIANRIINKIPDKNNLQEYLGNDLDVKIAREISIYQEEQNAAIQQQPSAPAMMSTCDSCGMNVDCSGKSYTLNCNNHEYCSSCYQQQAYPYVCPNCRMQRHGNFCEYCGVGCYTACPKCLEPAEPATETIYY